MSTVKLQLKAKANGAHVEAKARKHTLIIDEGKQQGGTDQGANPLETLLAALSGCESAVSNMVAKEMNFDLQGIEFDIQGELDPRGFMGQEGIRRHFEKVTLRAVVETSESEARIQELKAIVDDRCPVYQTLVAAGVEMDTEWVKA
ncbi:OsmC family protein [Pontibacillus litoralis]|uniref:Osmotically inducible protein C n=1 Tax=Pontibacillus litoralis JSM 072002 TaxID=1385512 RepID=A0A0A5HQ73_9BACI|nr:OsmC family protein [Pontibacillus litoralis]KGX85772.1 osmotically inducible protein C [Pontibacillus litoralis JSM 072002]